MSRSQRLYFLDNLRVLVVLLVVILHGSLSYMAYAPEWWYVVDTQTSIIFTKIVILTDVPIMLIMFFLAGYFAFPSLAKRGAGKFCREKLLREGLPWILGAMLLAPPTAYMTFYSRKIPVGFWQFWGNDFWHAMYQQSVYWFLGVLLFFFLLMAMVYVLNPGFRALRPQPTRPSPKLFLGFGLLMTAGFLTMNQFFPLDTWYTKAYVLVFQPLRAPLYIGYFILGIHAYRRGWFTDTGYMPRLLPWGLLCLVSGFLYLKFRLGMPPQSTFLVKGGNALLFNSFCLTSLMAGCALCKRVCNCAGGLWKNLAANSYGIYFIHPVILYPLAYLVRPAQMPLAVKSSMVILAAILLSWAFSALVLKKLPILKRSF